jgi:hypothetical protein
VVVSLSASTVTLPDVAFVPLHAPAALHDCAFSALHASVALLPRMTRLGFNCSCTTGFALVPVARLLSERLDPPLQAASAVAIAIATTQRIREPINSLQDTPACAAYGSVTT